MSSLNHSSFFAELSALKPKFISYAEVEIPKVVSTIEHTIEETPYLSWVSILAKKAGHSCAPLPNPDSDNWTKFKAVWPEEVQHILIKVEPKLQSFAQKYRAKEQNYALCKSFFVENDWLYSGKQVQEERAIATTFSNGFKLNHTNFNLLNKKWSNIQQLLESPSGQAGSEYYLDESQKEAVVRSLLTRIAIITGGPGTGKTTTARRLLEAFLLLWDEEGLPRIRMAAPTGKAAARLTESMSLQQTPDLGQLQTKINAIPTEASTLHRLLGMGTVAKPKHNAENPIDADLILVDEASMIDQYLMNMLLNALAPNARLILIGDRHQLPSVEAGAVFAQLYPSEQTDINLYKNNEARQIVGVNTNEPQSWAVAQLQKGHRSGAASGISKLAEYMQNSEALPNEIDYSDIHLFDEDYSKLQSQINRFISEEKAAFKQIQTVEEAFQQIRKNQFLTITSKCKRGAEGINNEIIKKWTPANRLEEGFRIIIRQNDYQNGLFNGEIGVYLKLKDEAPKFYFEGREAGSPPRSFLPQQLNRFEYAFALTVHKSQGSEYDTVHLIAPDSEERHPLFSKELLYTALTRSKIHFYYWGKRNHLEEASISPQQRFSQLREKIWGK